MSCNVFLHVLLVQLLPSSSQEFGCLCTGSALIWCKCASLDLSEKQLGCEKELGQASLLPSICAPSAHESGAAFTPPVVLVQAPCGHAVPSLVPGLCCLTGWTSDLQCGCQCVWLPLGYFSPTLLPIFRQGGTGQCAGEDTALLALLLP